MDKVLDTQTRWTEIAFQREGGKAVSRQKVLFPTIHLVLVVFFLVGCSTPADIPTAVVFVGTTPSVVPSADASEESVATTSTPGPTVTATVGPGGASCDANSPPIADAGGPYNAMMGKGYAVVIFDASNSTDSDGTIEMYEWDFGDNSASDSGQSVSHAYSSTGIFEAKLTVRDNCGATSQDTAEVTIVAPTSTCAPPSGWVIYVVRRGDNLFRLSLNTQTTVAQVKQANCLVGDVIKVGQRLYLPSIPGVPTSPTATAVPVTSVSPTPALTETPVPPTVESPTSVPPTDTPVPPRGPDLVIQSFEIENPEWYPIIGPTFKATGEVVVKNVGDLSALGFDVGIVGVNREDKYVQFGFFYDAALTVELTSGQDATLTGVIELGHHGHFDVACMDEYYDATYCAMRDENTLWLMAIADYCEGYQVSDHCAVEEIDETNNARGPVVVEKPES